ncbi:RWD domain-containing protein 2B [Pseudocercospora fuligena]|uniref:RWD domain-containing protein 2B n=1 Tax=Pseudocercospora fuligena TaxID=685502 RepID=A0A8H6RGZ7_9PEZI|nr:RWD domain-containing protein 2B [Pseudocercospora fuligena]
MAEDERLATELELLKSMFADQVEYNTKGRELSYSTGSGTLRVRLPYAYLQDALPEVLSASIGKSDMRDKIKQRIAGFGFGDEILDSIIMAFNDLIDHVAATNENIGTEQSAAQPDTTTKATIVVWLHHLLNTNKRKQCLHPPSPGISGVTKPGYPGVLVYSGPSAAVHEHVNELKALNWAAFQVRLEQDQEWTFKHGEGVIEVESMGEVVTEIDVGDGRKDMFLEAMKMK